MNPQQSSYTVEYSSDEDRQCGTLIAGRDFGFEFEALEHHLNSELSSRLVDLLRISMAIYVVDRLVRRERGTSSSWARTLKVRVDTLDPDFWNGREIVESLQQTVEFVSGDFWDFEFFGRSPRYEWNRPLLSNLFPDESPLICLYSGGLDSAAGLGLQLVKTPERLVLPVTVKHQPRQQPLVKSQFRHLKDRLGARIEPLIIKLVLKRPDGSKWSNREKSQRSRAFLFAAAGAVASAVARQSSVEVFESGIGSLNIPLMAGMVGSKATKTCHPEFLRQMSHLVSLVVGREIAFRLPFYDQTKGEMVRELRRSGLADVALATVSCARYPVGHSFFKQCGICPACIFRRQAMLIGEIDEPEGTYAFDLFGPTEQVNAIQPDHLIYLRAFLMQVAEWTDTDATDGLPQPVERHLRYTRILQADDSPERIVCLLVRYRDEWLKIAAEGRRNGYRWAELLAPASIVSEQGARYAPV